jgi:hypothetical protein
VTTAVLHELLDHPQLPDFVAGYLAAGGDGPRFTGSRFETLGGPGDAPEVADRFTPADLLAVTTLSVQVPARTAIWILDEGADRLTASLAQIPTDVEPHDALGRELLTDPSSPLNRLWTDLKARDGIGWVTAGKLCARKRPRLAPIYDEHVRAAVGAPASWWAMIADAFTDQQLLDKLDQLRDQAQVPEHISRLRLLDIAIWMRQHGYQWLTDTEATAP